MKVTIREIAQIANVSRGTVDKVLNNRPGVSDPVRERVKKVAAALNYQPNIIGKALARQHTPKKIGVIVAPDYNPFVKDIKLGIEAARHELADYGFQIDMRVLNTLDASEQLNILGNFIDNGIDAIAMFSIDSEDIRQKVDEMAGMGVPVVTYNTDIHNSKRLCYVGQDHYQGGIVAADLMSKVLCDGADVLIITSLVELECHRERIAGFKAGLNAFSPQINIVEIVENEDKGQLAFSLTLKKLEQYPNINGIYVTGGGVSGVGEALKMLDRERAVRVICHDLVESTASLVKEGVVDFTIGQDPFFQGYQPVKLLFDYLIAGKTPEEEFVRTRIDIRSRSTI